jgi:hypothetical protein
MAANNISNALKNPHPEVPFSHIGDGNITALTTLDEIFKNNFQKVQIPGLPTAPAKVAKRISHQIIQSHISLSHASVVPYEITNNNSRSRHSQRAITSEGGHTYDE